MLPSGLLTPVQFNYYLPRWDTHSDIYSGSAFIRAAVSLPEEGFEKQQSDLQSCIFFKKYAGTPFSRLIFLPLRAYNCFRPKIHAKLQNCSTSHFLSKFWVLESDHQSIHKKTYGAEKWFQQSSDTVYILENTWNGLFWSTSNPRSRKKF